MLLSVWLLTGESTCMDDIPLFAEMREIVAILIDSTERIMVIIGVRAIAEKNLWSVWYTNIYRTLQQDSVPLA